MHIASRFAFRIVAGLGLAASLSMPASAQDVFITQELPFFEFDNGEEFHVIERDQNTDAVIPEAFAKTSRPCPPFCVQPMEAAEGVETIGELELLQFLDEHVEKGTGALIDARVESWYRGGTIPGSINLAFNLFENPEENPFLVPVLQLLGGVQAADGTWDFTEAKDLALFCNGPWCGQSPRAIRNLISVGYPPEKLRYYRGGMQAWLALGLSVHVPGNS
ncbi:rhodanese-like domain-containing protein [Actibacterium sp. XHP0104]|uniref:rhodanese-like domain-containing protein n=1 Tax=Actibacterium sp. XHP0104 TaxID=2984335 RepID=UPI0021E7E902|nr:rhodanese-like domain-containing protein [Actibacterium sp. XHP0104]MCV2880420.1 rhodanese-like domain-containing protein [Actibacterium sp. XHP0104]